jgi:hypothetical protein
LSDIDKWASFSYNSGLNYTFILIFMAGPDEIILTEDIHPDEHAPPNEDAVSEGETPVSMADILRQCETILYGENGFDEHKDDVSERIKGLYSDMDRSSQIHDRNNRYFQIGDVDIPPLHPNFGLTMERTSQRVRNQIEEMRRANRAQNVHRIQAASQFSEKLFGSVWTKASQEYFSDQVVDLILFAGLMERLENHLAHLSEEEQTQVIEVVRSASPRELFINNWRSIPVFLEVLQEG